MTVIGFIVQPTYRLERGRAVFHLYGRLSDGRPFLVRDHRPVPYFYVEKRDAERARQLVGRQPIETDRVTFDARPVVRFEASEPGETAALRDRLAAAGIATYEADVRFAMRPLFERGIRGSLAIRGTGRELAGLGVVFDEPSISPADWTPALRVLSLDIETDPAARRLLAVGLHGCGVSEVLLLTPPGWECPAGALAFPDERALIAGLAARVRELDPDVLTGWNVIEFDLAVLARLADRLRVPLELGRGAGGLRLRSVGSPRGSLQASVPGRVVLDGILLVRGAFIRMEDYTLDAVARSVLGEGKTLSGAHRADEILRLFKEDRARFVEYNRADARLALEILEKLRLVELAVERSRVTGLPLDRVSGSIAAFDSLYLRELGRRRIVAPSVRSLAAPEDAEPQSGGHVLEPLPGLYSNVVVLDFKSLYPSLIRTFEIDPLNLVRLETGAADPEAIVAPNGAAFSRTKSILGALLDEIVPQREAARRAGDHVKSHALKILMNSFYGVLGTPACRFYEPRLANAITGFGREVLLWCKARIEAGEAAGAAEGAPRGAGGPTAGALRVLYGDTDSLFVESGLEDAADARAFGSALAQRLTGELASYVRSRWRVESRLELAFDRLYLRLCLPALRHSAAGARKRYAGLVLLPSGARSLVFTGMEAVRGDWTDLAKQVQRELYARLFADTPAADAPAADAPAAVAVEEYLRGIVAQLRSGALDAQLVYRKGLRKPPEAYTTTTPPHVAAARLTGQRRGRIAYVITTAGPRPVTGEHGAAAAARGDAAGAAHAPLDYDHYVETQLRAVAEPVLALLGLEFESVVGSRSPARQLPLF